MLKGNLDIKSTDFDKRFEKINTEIFETSQEASSAVASEIAKVIREKQNDKQRCILGLATGATPIPLYKELIRLHKYEDLSFKNVVTFNLDEYYYMKPNDLHSYVYFMKEQLFNHIDILPENFHIPDGTLSKNNISAYCSGYECQIDALGGLDLQILGIGHNGHIGFNEPGSLVNSKTRLVTLDYPTRLAASKDFDGLTNTPRTAITLGLEQIMKAKKVILMAWGEGKSKIIKEMVEGTITPQVPASHLQNHKSTTVVVDKSASIHLTRIDTPWLVGDVKEWTPKLIRKAVVNLAMTLGKPILTLTNADYIENGLSELILHKSTSYDVNIQIFNQLQHTITGWPGGKPDADDTHRPERAQPIKKRVLIFSPHPDDDVISMGGTFQRLQDQGHEVHVAYQTSGNIAVADAEALRFAQFICDYNTHFGIQENKSLEIYKKAEQFLANEKTKGIDIPEIRHIKGLIRKGEAQAASRFVGLSDDKIHFMNLPFYETGKVEKNPISEEDIKRTVALIDKIKPHQIYAAGDLADPHGTHEVCLNIVFESIKRLKDKPYMKDCWVWLYRGAWKEWNIDEIEMAVPMSPYQVIQKRDAIFKHQSQKDGIVFQGSDTREFWQRAADRNKETAEAYRELGLSHYAAMEAFVRWKPDFL